METVLKYFRTAEQREEKKAQEAPRSITPGVKNPEEPWLMTQQVRWARGHVGVWSRHGGFNEIKCFKVV